MSATDQEYEAVVARVRHWPIDRQFALLHEMLHVLASEQARAGRDHGDGPTSGAEDQAQPARRSTLARAIGLLKTSEPPPTDEEVRRLLEERRMEKYG